VPHLRGGCGSGMVELLGAEDAAERLAALRGDEGAGSEAFVALLAGCAKLAEDGDAGALRRGGQVLQAMVDRGVLPSRAPHGAAAADHALRLWAVSQKLGMLGEGATLLGLMDSAQIEIPLASHELLFDALDQRVASHERAISAAAEDICDDAAENAAAEDGAAARDAPSRGAPAGGAPADKDGAGAELLPEDPCVARGTLPNGLRFAALRAPGGFRAALQAGPAPQRQRGRGLPGRRARPGACGGLHARADRGRRGHS